jgi:hypothetical protein
MKKAILFFFFVAYFINLSGQQPTVAINCQSTGTDCFSIDPCVSPATYEAVINNAGLTTAKGYSRKITWTVTGDFSSRTVSGDELSSSVTWNNQPNSTLNKVKLTVDWTKDGTFVTSQFEEMPVTIKHMASITQLNISGAISSSPANGGTVNIPCGSQSLTISVPTPVSNPNTGIIYTWSLPSGWSGSSSTNTINVTTSAGAGGTILVSAKRNDVSCSSQSSYSISVNRPLVGAPSITGIPAASLCYYTGASLTGNSTNATSFNWTTTGPLVNGFSSSNFFSLFAGSSGSSGTVTLTADNACQAPQSITQTITIGPPIITSATVNGQSQSTPNYIFNPALLNIGVNNPVGVTYNWAVIQGTGSFYYNGQNSVSAYAYPFVRIEATTSNQCGAGAGTTFYLYNVSGGYYRMTSPNPATSTVSTEVIVMDALKKMTLVSDAHAGIVRMYNANGSANADTHRNNNLLSFDVGNLPRGKYFLNFTFEGNKTFTEQIVLE